MAGMRVRTYSGYRADERPLSFEMGERVVEVTDCLDRWYGEGYEYFKVRGGDGDVYILRHGLDADLWDLVMMEKEGLGQRGGG